jgi:hypothetical protein
MIATCNMLRAIYSNTVVEGILKKMFQTPSRAFAPLEAGAKHMEEVETFKMCATAPGMLRIPQVGNEEAMT